MPTFGRKLRIFVEWSWGMFFPTDITHLRFTRSNEADEANRETRSAAPVAAPLSAAEVHSAADAAVAVPQSQGAMRDAGVP
jgi:NADH:ubiquinone reductase (H+-translocating)